MKIGIRVPSYGTDAMTSTQAVALGEYARRTESLGFDSLWVIDHLLVSPPIYRVAWMDPLVTLAFLAGCTSSIELGSGVVVVPLRNPVLFSKEVASLQMLSGDRLILGVAPGWYRPEFLAVGVDPHSRGRRTDESLALMRLLLRESSVSFHGEFFDVDDVTIVPRPMKAPPIWVAGGSATDASSGLAFMPKPVLARIAHADGWLSGSSGRPESFLQADVGEIRDASRALGRKDDVVFAHTQFLHLCSDERDREHVISEQMNAFRSVMGERSEEELLSNYLFGNADEILSRVFALSAMGVDHLILTPVTDSPKQLDEIAKRILRPFREDGHDRPYIRTVRPNAEPRGA